MSLMTSMWVGVSGLRAQQNAINTTSHNLANIYSEGYVRQQVSMADNTYQNFGQTQVNTKQLGLGVVSAETRHIRDLLLDKAFRKLSGSVLSISMYETLSPNTFFVLPRIANVTLCPCSSNAFTVCIPKKRVPPITKMFICRSIFNLLQQIKLLILIIIFFMPIF